MSTIADVVRAECARLQQRAREMAAPPRRPLGEHERAFLRGEISVDDLFAEKCGYRLIERGRSGGNSVLRRWITEAGKADR